MAAPTVTARQTPTGIRIDDGLKTTITFANSPAASIWEESVKPPAIDGGDAIPTTNMFNTAWRTSSPKKLKTLGEVSFSGGYDPSYLTTILAQVNVAQSITVTFPDGSTLAFWGFLNKFEPSENKEGDQPKANVSIMPTNWDPAGRVEAGPVFTGVTGT